MEIRTLSLEDLDAIVLTILNRNEGYQLADFLEDQEGRGLEFSGWRLQWTRYPELEGRTVTAAAVEFLDGDNEDELVAELRKRCDRRYQERQAVSQVKLGRRVAIHYDFDQEDILRPWEQSAWGSEVMITGEAGRVTFGFLRKARRPRSSS